MNNFLTSEYLMKIQASGDDSSNLSLVMVRLKENIYEDSVNRLWLDHDTLDVLRKSILSESFLGKWTLGGNHRFKPSILFSTLFICCDMN